MTKLLITFILLVFSIHTYGQKELRIGLTLVELEAVSIIDGGLPECCEDKIFVVNALVLEKTQNAFNHRFEVRGYKINNMFGGDAEIKQLNNIQVGYDFLYSFKKLKPVNFGFGVRYHYTVQKWDPLYYVQPPSMATTTANAIGYNIIIEANFKLGKSFYLSPSTMVTRQYQFAKYSGIGKNEGYSDNRNSWNGSRTPFRLTLKKIINQKFEKC